VLPKKPNRSTTETSSGTERTSIFSITC
jgi:hypothetical protein